MILSQLKKPKPPFPRSLPLNVNRNVFPATVMKFHFVQIVHQSTSSCFDKSFFQTPISAQYFNIVY